MQSVTRNEQIAPVCAQRVNGRIVKKPEYESWKSIENLSDKSIQDRYVLFLFATHFDDLGRVPNKRWKGKVTPCCYRLAHTQYDGEDD